jgi:hypothetical protein
MKIIKEGKKCVKKKKRIKEENKEASVYKIEKK